MDYYYIMIGIWIFFLFLGIIIESGSAQAIGFGISFGSTTALITNIIKRNEDFWLQFVVFLGTWIFVWIFFLLIAKKFFKNKNSDDGFQTFYNQDFVVLKNNVQNDFGDISLNGKIFRFRCKELVWEKEKVKLIEIQGVTAIVKKVKQKNTNK